MADYLYTGKPNRAFSEYGEPAQDLWLRLSR